MVTAVHHYDHARLKTILIIMYIFTRFKVNILFVVEFCLSFSVISSVSLICGRLWVSWTVAQDWPGDGSSSSTSANSSMVVSRGIETRGHVPKPMQWRLRHKTRSFISLEVRAILWCFPFCSFFFFLAVMNKLIKEIVPNIRVSNEARDLLLNCCSGEHYWRN